MVWVFKKYFKTIQTIANLTASNRKPGLTMEAMKVVLGSNLLIGIGNMWDPFLQSQPSLFSQGWEK